MYTREDFEADVDKNFAFLISEHGMRRDPLRASEVGSWITFANAVAKVIVEYEVGGYCGVTVMNPRHVKRDPLERSEFDLDEIVALSGQRPPRRQEPRTTSDMLARAAETLRTVGDSVLKGAFEHLHDRQLKVVEAVRRTNPATTS